MLWLSKNLLFSTSTVALPPLLVLTVRPPAAPVPSYTPPEKLIESTLTSTGEVVVTSRVITWLV